MLRTREKFSRVMLSGSMSLRWNSRNSVSSEYRATVQISLRLIFRPVLLQTTARKLSTNVRGAPFVAVLVQREMESGRFAIASVPPLRGGDFQGMGKSIEVEE